MHNKYLEQMLYESDMDPVGLPEGVTFLSDKKSNELDKIVSNITKIFRENKYNKVLPPVFEYYETFEKGSGLNIARKAFSFKDKDGKMLSLRYDMTTPIARMASMKYEETDLPIRFFYHGDVFREQPIHAGKPRQLRQVGIELIGEAGLSADVETVNLLGASLSALSKSYKLVIGDIRFYRQILSQMKLTQSQVLAVTACMNRKDTVSMERILRDVESIAGYKNFLLDLPYIVGNPALILKELKKYEDLGFDIYTERLMKIVEKVDPKVRKNIIIDLGLIKDFSYYTSLTLEGYIDKVGYPIANGGRYDELFQSFGKDFPAIGFAVDVSYYV